MANADKKVRNPIFCAVDTADLGVATTWAARIGDHVGGIKPASKPRFNYCKINILGFEMNECHCSHPFEKGWVMIRMRRRHF